MILTKFKCDIRGCENEQTENTPGEGAQGWGEVRGLVLDNKDNPVLCPNHLAVLAEFLDTVMS